MTIVTDYIAALSPSEAATLSHLRDLVYATVPTSEDAFSYGVPTYRYKGKYLIGFAANKNFMSIYPGAAVIEVLKDELRGFKQSKGTISFTAETPISDDTLRTIITYCKDAIDQKK